MGLQSAINNLIGTAGAAAALTDLNSSAKSTAKTVKELGDDSKMALKAQNELQQKLDAIHAQQLNAIFTKGGLSDKARTRFQQTAGEVMDDLNKAEKMDARTQVMNELMSKWGTK